MKKPRYGRRPCPYCGELITNNALGHASHVRACKGKKLEERERLLASIKTVAAKLEE